MNLAARVYLDIAVANKHPEQEPAYEVASNWDLLWLLVPVAGFLLFTESIKARYADRHIGPGI